MTTRWSSRCIKTKHNKTMDIKTITCLETVSYPWSSFSQINEATTGAGTETRAAGALPVHGHDICWTGVWLRLTTRCSVFSPSHPPSLLWSSKANFSCTYFKNHRHTPRVIILIVSLLPFPGSPYFVLPPIGTITRSNDKQPWRASPHGWTFSGVQESLTTSLSS